MGVGVLLGVNLIHKAIVEDLCIGIRVDGCCYCVVDEAGRDAARGRCRESVRAASGHWG